MKYRFLIAIVAVTAAVAFGLAVRPAHAAAATVELSAAQRATLSAALTLTKASLDATQRQLAQDPNAIADRGATIAALNGIRTQLVTIRTLIGGAPVTNGGGSSGGPVTQGPYPAGGPVAQAPSPAPAPAPAPAPEQPAPAPQQPSAQTASVSSHVNWRWVFWGILIVAIVVAAVLMIPRKKAAPTVAEDRPIPPAAPAHAVPHDVPAPQASSSEEPPTVQSA